jgi:phosphate transport system protein
MLDEKFNSLGARQHISSRFSEELEAIKNSLLEMGGKTESQIHLATEALLSGAGDIAEEAVQMDRDINQMEVDIDDQCARIIARRQPAAFDLRLIISIAKVTTDLERIGDEATKVARMALKTTVRQPVRVAEGHTTALANHVSSMLRSSLDAFARLNVNAAVRVMLGNKNARENYDAGMKLLEAAIKQNPETLKSCMDQIWALRSLDRIGDHASNIAEQIVYLVTGSDVRHMDESTLLKLLDVSTDS